MPRVVITLPAYRAERTLARTVADIPRGVADRLILVDDASPDNTAQVARELGIEVHVHRENLGYGGNQKTCYIEALASGADIVVLLHPDYQYEPKAVPLLIAPILAGDADMTFGSRFAGLGNPIAGGMPLYRYVGNRVTTIAENLMLGSRFTELHSGLRAFTRRCLLSLPILRYSNDFLFDSQLLIDAVTTGQRVVEVPIPTRYTKESSSIAIDRSLRYVAGTLGYCARTTIRRGRRGRRARLSSPFPLNAGTVMSTVGADACPACAAVMDVSADGGSGRCPTCGLVAPHRQRFADSGAPDVVGVADGTDAAGPLNALADYYVAGNRVLVFARDEQDVLGGLARQRGWVTTSTDANGSEHEERGTIRWPSERRDDSVADAILFLDTDASLPDRIETLRRARSLVQLEGLLIVATPIDVSSVKYTLTRASVHAVLARSGFDVIEWVEWPRLPLAPGVGRGETRRQVVVARPAHVQ
jgi:hypothetical protein